MMKSHEQKYSEAVQALAHRLGLWGVDAAEAKAHEFIRDLVHHGWRGSFNELDLPRATSPASPMARDAALSACRDALRAGGA